MVSVTKRGTNDLRIRVERTEYSVLSTAKPISNRLGTGRIESCGLRSRLWTSKNLRPSVTKRGTMNHMPFDNGALRFLREINGQKTIKTRCDKRVPFTQADEREPVSCAECQSSIAREKLFLESLWAELKCNYPTAYEAHMRQYPEPK